MLQVIIVSAVLALAASAAVVVTVAVKYKSGLSSPIYPLEHYSRLNLTHSQDALVGRTVTRVRVAPSNNKR